MWSNSRYEYSELYTSPIWYNPLISEYPLFSPNLYKNGINIVGDLLTNDGNIITRKNLLIKTRLDYINPLHYLQLRSCVTFLLKNITFQPNQLQKPLIPLLLRITIKNNKGSKDFYNILQQRHNVVIQHKWEAILNINKTTQEWEQIYKICFKTLPDNYLIYQQYKIINQILGTRSLQYKMSITKDKQCSFCKEHEETLMHLFFDCDQVFLLLQVLYDWILNKTNIQIILNKTAFILGYTYPLSNQIPINTINMITKSYIFHCSRNSKRLNIYHLQNRIKDTFETQEYISKKNNQLDKFNKIWNNFKSLYDE